MQYWVGKLRRVQFFLQFHFKNFTTDYKKMKVKQMLGKCQTNAVGKFVGSNNLREFYINPHRK